MVSLPSMASNLFDAIERHDAGLLESLLSKGEDPNAPDEEGWRPLHAAIGELSVGGPVESVALLIEYGADVNEWDVHRNETPLLSASTPAGLQAARRLLEAGADPNVRNKVGDSPLRRCAWEEDLDMAKLLLEHGAAETIDEFGGDFAWTALGIAAHKLNLPMIELFLQAGADPAAEDDMGRTARDHLPPRETCDPRAWDRVHERLRRRT